jgi:glycosyltransferase involved in cell wall biosynthesis
VAELRVALVHDWLTNQGGAERVLWAFHQAYPDAPIYTSVYNAAAMTQFAQCDVRTSFLQNWPLAQKKHQLYPKLRQIAFESFDFSEYDVVLSTSSAESKGVITGTNTLHISYLHTPTRYYWSDYDRYLASPGFGWMNPIVRFILPRMISSLRHWDYAAAQRPDILLANSQYVAARIKKYYGLKAAIIYPPVSVDRFRSDVPKEDYYIVVSRLIPYKRVDLAVVAARDNDLPLIVIGDGSERAKLELVAGPKTKFLGRLSDEEVAQYYERAKGFIFTAEEDFGITPLEAQAAGMPVLAFGKGGALETIIDGKTGMFFKEQTRESVTEALALFEKQQFKASDCREQAQKFSEERFINEIQAEVASEWAKFRKS